MKALLVLFALCLASCTTRPQVSRVAILPSFDAGVVTMRLAVGVVDIEIRYDDVRAAAEALSPVERQKWIDRLDGFRSKDAYSNYDSDVSSFIVSIAPDFLDLGRVVVRDARSRAPVAFILKGVRSGGVRYYCLPDGTEFLTDYPLKLTPHKPAAQQGARANAGICHAACSLMMTEAKQRTPDPNPARSAPAPGVAHL